MHMMSVRINFGVRNHRRDRVQRSFSRSIRVVCLQARLHRAAGVAIPAAAAAAAAAAATATTTVAASAVVVSVTIPHPKSSLLSERSRERASFLATSG